MSALTTPTYSNRREKKKKRNESKEPPTSDRKPIKGKEKNHLKKTSLGPLRQRQRLDTSETKLCSSKERKPPNQSSKNHKELPLHTCKLPLNQWNSKRKPPNQSSKNHKELPPWTNASSPWTNATPPRWMHAKHHMKQSSCNSLALTGQTGHPHRSDRWARSPSTWELHRSDRCPSPMRPMPPGKLPELKNSSKPLRNFLNACSKSFQAQTSPPCWQCMNQAKNAQNST
jgi:hypothetical protein